MTTKLLTVREVATVTGASEKTVRRRMKDGTLPIVRFGRLVRVDEQALMQWIASGGQTSPMAGEKEAEPLTN